MRPSDGGGGRHFHHRGMAGKRGKAPAAKPERATPLKRAGVMDQAHRFCSVESFCGCCRTE